MSVGHGHAARAGGGLRRSATTKCMLVLLPILSVHLIFYFTSLPYPSAPSAPHAVPPDEISCMAPPLHRAAPALMVAVPLVGIEGSMAAAQLEVQLERLFRFRPCRLGGGGRRAQPPPSLIVALMGSGDAAGTNATLAHLLRRSATPFAGCFSGVELLGEERLDAQLAALMPRPRTARTRARRLASGAPRSAGDLVKLRNDAFLASLAVARGRRAALLWLSADTSAVADRCACPRRPAAPRRSPSRAPIPPDPDLAEFTSACSPPPRRARTHAVRASQLAQRVARRLALSDGLRRGVGPAIAELPDS